MTGSIAELENEVFVDKNSLEAKLKAANSQLSVKAKEVKKAVDDLKKVEKRANELGETVKKNNNKISELEEIVVCL